MAPHPPGQYLRSDSGGSDTPMLTEGAAAGPAPGHCPGAAAAPDGGPGAARGQRRRRCGPLWGSVAVMAILALQIASTTGLFVYFTMAISKLKSQAPGSAEELRCLQALNQQPEGSSLEKLSSSQGCLKLASTIKAYVATVTENIIRRNAVKEAWRNYFNTSEGQLPPKTAGKPSAHLTLRPQSLAQDGRSQRSGNLSQSCRHAITHWGHGSLVSHVQNMTYRAGRLRVEQPGKYYVADSSSSRPVTSSSSPSPPWPSTPVTQPPVTSGPSGSTCDTPSAPTCPWTAANGPGWHRVLMAVLSLVVRDEPRKTQGWCPQGPAVLGATLQLSARKGLQGPTGDMHKEGPPSPGGTAPTNSSLQQERHQGHCKTKCPHRRVTPMSLMLPWAALWVPGPGAGSTPGHRGTPCGDGAGPVSASGREQRSCSLGEESLGQQQ
ncbi:uncharacterized protein LOC132079894 isoform X1 [Ammospiza nelsoni]|uniref:uncharacterized protein LOC132079894 isoform X1 n=1 Tax=Ammospiza nelsoni TaxID=2857394 RepID=UPI002869C9C1|nr:uncharacterized protein LOC132079894 isoform X1 [Ammospiza nelsoni]